MAEWAVASGFNTVTDINGVQHNIQSDLDAGKYVIVDASATWCAPCWSLHQSGVFEDLWNDYGPAGTDELMIYWIETDSDTGIDDIEGNTSASQGDFTNGGNFPVPIINDGSAAAPFSELYSGYIPEVYMICPSGSYKIITGEAWDGATQVYNTINSCPNQNNDMEVEGISYTTGTDCTMSNSESISVDITNIGLDDVTGVEVSYSIDGGIPVTENISTVIGPMETFTYTFSQTADFSALGTYELVASVNWAEDNNTSNNEKTTYVVSGDTQLVLDLVFDSYPGETSWDLVDDFSGNTIGASPDYADAGSGIFESFCLISTKCYTFTIHDEYGDGICCAYGNGSYTLTLNGTEIATGGNFNYSESTSIDAQPDVELNDITVCTGEAISWDTSGEGIYSHVPGDIDNGTVGETTVTYVLNEGTDCEVSTSFVVSVVDATIDITADDIVICESEAINFPAGYGTFDPSEVDNTVPGTTTVTYEINTGMSCENSTTFDVTVLEAPEAPATLSDDYVLSTTADGDLQWYFEGDPIDGATDTTYTCTENGTYYLIVTADNGCSTQSEDLIVSGLSIDNPCNISFGVYPNPAENNAYIDIPVNTVHLSVYDITGKRVVSKQDFSGGNLDLSGLYTGIYFIKLENKGISGIEKLIVK
ncbi:MAG: T9SS type A sorting domain-containing protein [Bacteroidota bacterium]|nr:T9SS type A sorting domain-containing protein [Bacteroidota bacterium]